MHLHLRTRLATLNGGSGVNNEGIYMTPMKKRATFLVAACIATLGFSACSPPEAATTRAGTSALDAAPSCYAIKQSFPSSPDGIYWLLTPTMPAPQQFRCDMTTDGGGWVLIGRGREGWWFNTNGQGTAASIRNTPTGTGAFKPATLPASTINDLLAGGRSDALWDGIRVRRAADTTGTTYQEVRYRPLDQTSWSWAFGGGILLASADFDGVNYALPNSNAVAASTSDLAIDDGMQRIFTWPWQVHNSQAGFSYGQSVAGIANATSYLWTAANENYAIPFAQVWIRPMFGDDAGWQPIPDAGTPAIARAPAPVDVPATMPWGVTGLLKTADPDPGNDSPVLALVEIGNTIYVGGKFSSVQQGRNGTPTTQSFLAAFDRATGNWVSGFRPTVDGAIYDLEKTPDGKLLVAGNFTNINGVANTAGLAKLDPTNGSVVSGFSASLVGKRFVGTRSWARALDLHGNWAYVVGSFTQIKGGSPSTTVNSGGVARISLTDGKPDATFNATLDNFPMDVDASADGSRVYVAGRFTTVNATPSRAIAVLDTSTGALVPGLGSYVPNDGVASNQFMQSVQELPTSIALGGSQHSLQQYSPSLQLLRAHTSRYGGDYQALLDAEGVLIASCHCSNWLYSDNNVYPIDRAYSRVAPINWVTIYDRTTFQHLEDFQPQISMSSQYEGPWDLIVDAQRCLWVGGDLIGNWTGSWLGGFAKLCQRNATAPTTPGNFAKNSAATPVLTWSAASDSSGAAPSYEVLRDDRVIATLAGRSFTTVGSGRYFVRAVDGAGNRSASTTVIEV